MAPRDDTLKVLLLEAPSKHRDGRRLQLEIEGYDVTATWEVNDALKELPEVAFTYLVLDEPDEAARWRPLFEPKARPPILVFSDLSAEVLANLGLSLRTKDFSATKRN